MTPLPHDLQQALGVSNSREAMQRCSSREILVQPKLDGWRCLVHVAPEGVRAYSRAGERLRLGRLLENELAGLPDSTWLDGEIVAALDGDDHLGARGRGLVTSLLNSTDHPDLDREACPLRFVAFDTMVWNGNRIGHIPYYDRYAFLTKALASLTRAAAIGSAGAGTAEHADELYRRLVDLWGYEGAIFRDPLAPYANGKRGYGCYKIKASWTVDAVVMGFIEGNGKYEGQIGSIRFGQWRDDELIERGSCSGMTDAEREAISDDRDGWLGTVIELSHLGAQDSGYLLSPNFIRRRPDRDAADVTWHNR